MLALPPDFDQTPVATHFRSTWVTASQASLRAHGFGARYEASLPAEHRDALLNVVAGVWLPMAVALAHYGTADSLELPESTLVDIGEDATRRANSTMLTFLARMAKGAGVTPWAVLSRADRLWSTTCRGGGIAVYEVAPKEARLELHGFPLARFRYNVITARGIAQAVVERFCQKAYASEVKARATNDRLVLKLAWA